MSDKKNTKAKESSSKESWWEQKKTIIKLLGYFFLGIIAYLLLSNLPFFKEIIYPKIIVFNSAVSSGLLKILGYGTTWSGDRVMSDSTSISIRKGCDALAPIAIFCSVLLAYPAAWKKKIKAIFLGISILLLVNIIRIVSLFLFKIHAPDLFDLMHLVIWQGIFIFLALILCFYFMKSFESKTQENGNIE